MLLLCMLLTPISISTDRHVNLVLGLFLGDANYNFNQLSIYVVTLYAWKMETMETSANFSHNYLKLFCLFTYIFHVARDWSANLCVALSNENRRGQQREFFLQQG